MKLKQTFIYKILCVFVSNHLGTCKGVTNGRHIHSKYLFY